MQQPLAPRPRKPAWYKANTEQKDEYTSLLEQKLASIPLPASLSCDSPCCRLEDHSINHDSHVMDIMCAILETSHQCIPLSAKSSPGGTTTRNLPGWNENVAPVKKDALAFSMDECWPPQLWFPVPCHVSCKKKISFSSKTIEEESSRYKIYGSTCCFRSW